MVEEIEIETELVRTDDTEEIDGALESTDEGDLEIESFERSISLEKNDRSLSELYEWFTEGDLILDPEWQRQYVWSIKRASRLIESFLIGLPIPVVYLAINDLGKYEVIDGLQRLTSAFDFLRNKIKLSHLEILKELNGKSFTTLEKDLQRKLKKTTLRTFELAQSTPKSVMFAIFERLNTGGVPLNEMEIRNCLYRGKLNDLIKVLAKDANFLQCVNKKGIEKRMNDRTLALRFLAFYQMTYGKAKKGLKQFLNEFFLTYQNPAADKLKEFEDAFRKAMKAALTVFGGDGFRLRKKGEKGLGEWNAQVNAAVFGITAVSFTNFDLGALTRRADAIYESYVDLISTDDQFVDSVTISTGDFQKIEYSFSTWNQRLKEIMQDVIPNDPKRIFSRKLKDEMFGQNNTCHLCNQRITLISDAALDHDTHYWKGGLTVPENARLVHRLCNLQRPNDIAAK